VKVISQLIQHFWQRQALTQDQVEYLVNQGFVRAVDLPGFAPSTPADKQPSSFKFKKPVPPPHPLEGVEEQLRSKSAGRRSRGKSAAVGLSEKDLVRAVECLLDQRAAALESFRRWTEPLGRSDSWIDAAHRVRQTSAARLLDHLGRSLKRNAVPLGTLWNALDVEPLHTLIDAEDVRGSVPRAFRAALTNDGPLAAPHVFLLKHEPIAAAKALAAAHRRLASALHRLHDAQPKTIATALANGNHPVIFWSLVLLYNARRKPIDGPMKPRREYRLPSWPSQPVWNQAWTLVRTWQPAQAQQLLECCYTSQQTSRALNPLECQRSMHCPIEWRAPDNDQS
jgi:hypothetical protein